MVLSQMKNISNLGSVESLWTAFMLWTLWGKVQHYATNSILCARG